ncbi:MAG: hypothetical protein ACO3N1_04250 [Ilumatobacteraceae bacterium]
MKISLRPTRMAFSLVTATAIVLGAGVSGVAAAPNGPGRSGEAHAEHGHPNPEAVRGHDEEGKTGKGHESHGNGHGYGHGDHDDVNVPVADEPRNDDPVADEPQVDEPSNDDPVVDEPQVDEPRNDDDRAIDDAPKTAAEPTTVVPEAPAVLVKSVDETTADQAAESRRAESPAVVDTTVEMAAASDVEVAGVILRFR